MLYLLGFYSLSMNKSLTVEQKLGITGDYQYKALHTGFFLQSNWHNNKLISLRLVIKKGADILDLGTGSGNLELIYGDKVKSIVGVDYNPEALGFLKSELEARKIKNVKLVKADLRTLRLSDLGNKKFDLIIMVDVLEHLKLNYALRLVGLMKKLLRSNGKVCIVTPNYKSPWVIIEKIFDKFGLVPHLDGEQHLAKYDSVSLPQLFAVYGFKCISIRSFNFISWLFPNQKVSETLAKFELASKINFGNLLWGIFSIN